MTKAKRTQMQKPTPGHVWRQAREQGVVVTLPSGHVARLRGVGPDLLLSRGSIPDALTPLIAGAMGLGQDSIELDRSDLNTVKDFVALAEEICRLAFIEPRIVDEPEADDEISLDDLSFDDKMFVSRLLQEPVADLEKFRPGQAPDVEPVAAEPGDEPPAE